MKNILHKISIVVFLSAFVGMSDISAQQDLMLTQYMTSLQPTNAAYAGTSGFLNATAMTRNQWVGFEGAPTSQILMVNSPFLKHNLGVGFTLVHDKIGPLTQTLVFADIAYNFNLTEDIKLSMGVKSGLSIQKPDISQVSTVDPNDPAYNMEDNVELMPNFGFGLYLYSPKYYLGISTPKLMKNEYETTATTSTTGGEERHYFVIGGYLFDLDPKWQLKPTFMTKMVVGSPLSVDITTMAIYNNKIWFGAMYRFGDAIGFIFQYQINKQLRIGYAYDFALSKMMRYNSGTHELMISYDMIFKDEKIVTPRYF